MQIKTVFIDTDAGADDLLAIYYLIKSSQYKNINIIVNYGIFSREECLSRVSYFLGLFKNNKKIEIFLGEKKPLNGKFLPFYHIHGNKWINKKPTKVRQINNYDFNYKFDYLSIGPLTNLNNLAKKNNFLNKINKILIMGGVILSPGNASPLAEANFYWDPLAVENVFSKLEKKIIIVPLNITEKIQLTINDIDDKKLKLLFKPYLNYYLKQKRNFITKNLEKTKYVGAAVHDLVTSVILIKNKISRTTKIYISTEQIKNEPGFIFPVFKNEFKHKSKVFALKVVNKLDEKEIYLTFNKVFKK